MNRILPLINDRNHYNGLFRENSHWDPAIGFLTEKHHLKGPVQRGVLGSHIVYRVGDCWVKLMAPLFAQDMIYERSGLRAVDGNLSVKTPKIITDGNLEGWPYVILSHIDGEPIRNIWSQLREHQKIELADQIAIVTKEISRCRADDIIANRFVWNDFIQQQYELCEEQQKKKGLPDLWLKQLKDFLWDFDILEFQTKDPVFLHADLTFDHFLVTEGIEPKIAGIIDMADCQVGHFEYEFIAPTVFIFKGHQALLEQYLSQCGVSDTKMNQRFSEKLLAWSILHRYFSLNSYFQSEMSECKAGDFAALAEKVFPLR